MIDPAKVVIITPTHDGNVCSGYAGALSSSAGLYGAISFVTGNSNIALARNCQAGAFLTQTRFDWLLSIDADIQWSRRDLELLFEGDEQIVCAEYAKKDLTSNRPAQFGMGFVRIHRSVFEFIRSLTSDDNIQAGPGAPMVGSFIWQSMILEDFFPTGPALNGHFLGEDQGFFHLVHMAGITPRIEKRTSLVHWGRFGYHYTPVDVDRIEKEDVSFSLPEAQ